MKILIPLTRYNKEENLRIINNFVKEKHNGKCLSVEYKNNTDYLLFQCKYGHEWEASWSSVGQGCWCSECSSYFGERITRLFFESIFDKKFPKWRDNWLVSEIGHKMELDGYCPELGLAFEHHGLQHYQLNQWVNTPEKLGKVQNYDELKAKLCKDNNVKLITVPQVPQLTKIENLKQFIEYECIILNIPILKNIKILNINYELEPISFEYLKRYKEIAKSKGGQCLSEAYIGWNNKLSFICEKGHAWEAVPNNVARGSWCPHCRDENNKNNHTSRGIKTAIKPIVDPNLTTFEKCQEAAKQKNGICLSKNFIRYNLPLEFKCEAGHIWNAKPEAILLRGSWCRKCYDLKRAQERKTKPRKIK